MKRSQTVLYFIILILLILLIYREFGRDGGIPVDKERAKEHVIAMEEAATYTRAFAGARMELEKQLQDTAYLTRNFNLPVAESFNRHAIAALLNKKGADGIRIYLGLNPKREVVFVLVPVDGQGKDIAEKLVAYETPWVPGVSRAMALPPAEDAEAMERGHRCPHTCDLESPVTAP
ncbi:hypothetical protein [Chitinophaga alhagiae]|uniref:hypothetical protein n=1 Tax=Chitinophaga alhagiae TaxID=2203219 RepID=UPI000E5B535A|nr:hypothetical protein [Chitinophaga alhagiae]